MHKLKSLVSTRRQFLLLLLCTLIVYGISFYQHYSSYQYWLEHGDIYVVDDVVAMSGNDSYYWLKVARELDAGTLGKGQAEPTKGYPDGALLTHKDTPSLLAEMISFVRNFTDGNYYRAGLLLIPLLAGLFVLPLVFYFQRFRFGEAAVFGGLFASVSEAYFERIKLGRVDTDLLNLFFPLAISCFMLPLNRERGWRANLGLAAGAGLVMQLFVRWYQQSSFIAIYFCVLLIYLLLRRLPWRQVLGALVVFLLCSGPGYVAETLASLQTFVNAYISPPPTGLIAWPDILGVVNEAKAQGVLVTLKTLHPFLPLVAVGFIGLAYLCLRHFRQMVPLAPILALGAWSLIGPNRFSMYLAPMIAVGIGVVIQLAVQFFWRRSRLPQALASLATLFLLLVTFLSATAYSGLPKPPLPALDAATTRAIVDLKARLPQHSAMFNPFWEFGYALMEIGDFATYHDGGLQGGMRTSLTSIASMSSEQGDMVSLLAYLEDQGFYQLREKLSREKLNSEQMLKLVFDYPQPFSGENVYVLYLEPMIWKTMALARFGNWDFERRQSQATDYFDLPCFSMENNVLRCSDGTVDLNRGVMNDGRIDIPLKSALFVNDGYVVRQMDYPHDGEYYLQVLMHKGKIFRILVAGQRLFRSNFNQQYLLGNYDRNSFEEVYNDFPIARVFKVKEGAVGHPAEQR